jgi:hypothetical protein
VKPLGVMSVGAILLGGVLLASWKPEGVVKTHVPPPASILICGLQDHPCVTYTISYHEPTTAYGESQGEGVTDYQRKTIRIARSGDHFRNIEALQHEVFHAVLWERGFRDDSDRWDLHAWVYFSEGAFAILFHDNPDLVKYMMEEY